MLIIVIYTSKFALPQNPTRNGECTICLTAKADLNNFILYSSNVDQCPVKRKRKAEVKRFSS